MLNDKVIRTTFIISLAGHLFLLGMPGFNLPVLQNKKSEEITVRIEIEKPPLLPKIDIMGEEKKLKEIEEKPKEPELEPTSEPQPEEIVMKEPEPPELEQKPEPQPEKEEPKEPEQNPKPQPEELAVTKIPEKPIEEKVAPIKDVVLEDNKREIFNKVKVIDPSEEAMLRYQDIVKQRIEEVRRYPLWAKRQGIKGVVHLSFIVLPSGIAQDIRIVSSSGSKILDDEAVDTIKRASPFPPLPKEISTSFVQMEVSIVFTLQ